MQNISINHRWHFNVFLLITFSWSIQFSLIIKVGVFFCFCFLNFCHAAQNCSGLRTCGQCLEQPGCGWCNDPSNTGRGYCTEGSSRGPVRVGGAHSSEAVLDTSLCPREKNYEWSFIQCPGTSPFATFHGCTGVLYCFCYCAVLESHAPPCSQEPSRWMWISWPPTVDARGRHGYSLLFKYDGHLVFQGLFS